MRRIKRVAILAGLMAVSALLAMPQEGSGPGTKSEKTAGPILALGGLDPVSLVQGKQQEGEKTLSVVYLGYRYHFVNRSQQDLFEADPEKYSAHPADPVVKTRAGYDLRGNPEIFAVHGGKIYLFVNQDTRTVFERNPSEFVGGKEQHHSPEGSHSHPEGSHGRPQGR